MEVSYQRSPNRSYMILSGEETGETYEEEMLRQNAVSLLLSFYIVEIDRGMQVWYDITRLRSVRDIVRQEGVTVENIYMFLNGIVTAFSMLSQYLIREKNIVIDPDTVYFDRENPPQVRLCYCPLSHEDYMEGMRSLMSFFMDEADHGKEQVTRLVYRLYEMCQDPVSLEELAEAVRSELPGGAEQIVSYDLEGESPPYTDSMAMTPSMERIINESEPQESYMEREPEVVTSKKKKSSASGELMRKIRGFFADKFPVLAKAGKVKQRKLEDEGERPHDFSQDFVFDPDTDIQTKTVFIRPQEQSRQPGEADFQGILIYDGDGQEQDHHIRSRSFRIGSQEGENEAVLRSRVVSRQHARITRSGNDLYLEDLNSTNGTYLNGALLPYHDRVKLKKMDRIVFADVAYHII